MSALLRLRSSLLSEKSPLVTMGRRLSSETVATPATPLARPVRPQSVSPSERAALRAARKERAAELLAEQTKAQGGSNVATGLKMSKSVWYAAILAPPALISWAINDENSPPAKFSQAIGLTALIERYTDPLAKPSHEKLLPDWSMMPNVPQDIPVPHTLVLDLENTLVSSTWDRKHGWRHAKRPGVDRFLRELAQYYEIVLYSPSIDGVADPVVTSLDKHGAIMHRLYRDATQYHKGVHVKNLDNLNRNVKRMIVIDDDPLEVQFHPQNLIRVKPYDDPSDRTDNTLERILPFLIEIAREGYSDIPQLLQQYQGMDADAIADEQDRRIQRLKFDRQQRASHGLGALARAAGNLPTPELPPSSDSSLYYQSGAQLTAKDIAGSAPPAARSDDGLTGWMNRRAKEKEEHQMRKMEKWNEVMMKRQKERAAKSG